MVGRLHARALLQQGPSEWLGPGTVLPCPAHASAAHALAWGSRAHTRESRAGAREWKGTRPLGWACWHRGRAQGLAVHCAADMVHWGVTFFFSFFFMCALATWVRVVAGHPGPRGQALGRQNRVGCIPRIGEVRSHATQSAPAPASSSPHRLPAIAHRRPPRAIACR